MALQTCLSQDDFITMATPMANALPFAEWAAWGVWVEPENGTEPFFATNRLDPMKPSTLSLAAYFEATGGNGPETANQLATGAMVLPLDATARWHLAEAFAWVNLAEGDHPNAWAAVRLEQIHDRRLAYLVVLIDSDYLGKNGIVNALMEKL